MGFDGMPLGSLWLYSQRVGIAETVLDWNRRKKVQFERVSAFDPDAREEGKCLN